MTNSGNLNSLSINPAKSI
jgi:hypothetical protein